mmetsp:Transcript_9213/g.34037  ORF Transcript_9213/g.34037 Transcript_9213/m.34037 type:complete len:212 (+) Transcript_9213:6671-7306(+)
MHQTLKPTRSPSPRTTNTTFPLESMREVARSFHSLFQILSWMLDAMFKLDSVHKISSGCVTVTLRDIHSNGTDAQSLKTRHTLPIHLVVRCTLQFPRPYSSRSRNTHCAFTSLEELFHHNLSFSRQLHNTGNNSWLRRVRSHHTANGFVTRLFSLSLQRMQNSFQIQQAHSSSGEMVCTTLRKPHIRAITTHREYWSINKLLEPTLVRASQ